MDPSLALNLAKVNPLPKELQNKIWETRDLEIIKVLAENPSLLDRIALEMIEYSDFNLISNLLKRNRPLHILNKITEKTLDKHSNLLLARQMYLDENLIHKFFKKADSDSLGALLDRLRSGSCSILCSVKTLNAITIKYAQTVNKTTGHLGKVHTQRLGVDPKTWWEVMISNSENTGLLVTGISSCNGLNEKYLLKLFNVVNTNLNLRNEREMKDIEFVNKVIITNPYKELALYEKILENHENNTHPLTSETLQILQKRLTIDSKSHLNRLKIDKNNIKSLNALLDNTEFLEFKELELVSYALDNYSKLDEVKTQTYFYKIRSNALCETITKLEKTNQYTKLYYLIKEKNHVLKSLDKPEILIKKGCAESWEILHNSKEVPDQYHNYVALHYKEVKSLMNDPVYAGLIVKHVQCAKLKTREYMYKLLPEWDGSLVELENASYRLVS